MFDYVGYIFIFLLLILLTILFKIITVVETKSIKCDFEIEKAIIKTKNELKKRHQSYLELKSKYKQYSALCRYLSQVDIILDKYSFELNKLKIIRFRDTTKEESFDEKQFFNEYFAAPKELQVALSQISNALGEIYSWNHPIRFKYETYKKITMRILAILLNTIKRTLENEEKYRKCEQKQLVEDCTYLPLVS